ncbi:glutamate receptor 2-like isoform X1 [Montipora capricornis]|uniref:glutamate receptor 2-like isoform X1 n=1 Tax=Montipora capricornis TaxID=246305 RepID=UPI0035F1C452
METKAILSVLILTSSLTQRGNSSNEHTCGVIDASPIEYHAMTVALSTSSSFGNITITRKIFNVTNEWSLIDQATWFLTRNVLCLVEGGYATTLACALSTVTGIPLIRLHGNSQPFERCEKTLQLSASYKAYAHASLDILSTFHWTKVALVFDESRLHEAGYFHAISQSLKFTVQLLQIPEKVVISQIMQQIAELDPDMILLYTSTEIMKSLVQEKQCNVKAGFKWIVQGQAPMNLTCRESSVVLSMKLQFIEDKASAELRTAPGFNDKETVGLAYDAIQVVRQAMSTHPCSSINGSSVSLQDRNDMLECMKKVNIDGITGPVKFDDDGKRTTVELEILNLRNNSFVKIGNWNSTKLAVLYQDIRTNGDTGSSIGVAGKKIRAVVILVEPFFFANTKEDGTVYYTGYCIDLLNELARTLHFTYEIYVVPDGKYGALTENGTWNGMVGELDRKNADVAVGPLTATVLREKAVDFMMPFMCFTEDVLIRKRTSEKEIGFLQFMNPFKLEVWFCTLATIVIISISVFVINYYSPYGYKQEDGKGTSEEFNYFNSLWFSVACMLQQGGDNTPRSLSGRILAGCYWFCILIWVSTYTANLAAFFTVKNAEDPIANLEDIVKSSYQVGVLDSSSTHAFFQSSTYYLHQKIWSRMERVKNAEEGVRWVREKDKFVFISDGPMLQYIANQPPCNLKVVTGLTTSKGLSFAFQANSPYVNDFTLATLRLFETTFLDGLKRKWWDTANHCPEEEVATLSRQRIGLESMIGVYVVLISGIVTAFLTLFVERYWHKKEIKKSNLNKMVIRPNLGPIQDPPFSSAV